MKRAIQDIYPLSPTQRGLLFHSLYGNSQAGAYIVQVGYTLYGELNRTAFEQAWQQLANRHTILRTAFVWDNLDAPVQVVGQEALVPIHWQDWQERSADQQQENLSNLLTTDRAKGFDLSHAPLMRINAIQLSPNRYQILWTHHHMLLDGWSLPLLLKEWIVCYQAACAGYSAASAQLGAAYPYRDYIAWLQEQNLAAAKQFWKEKLAGFSAPTPLGIDGIRLEQTSKDSECLFKEQNYQLSSEISRQLKAFAQQHRLTLSSLVQGAWAKVLSVYSGDREVLYGLACAGRPGSLPAADRRVGLFINTLPMRVKVAPDAELILWLQQIQAQQLAQQPYEYTPLVEIQAVSDIPRRSPLFESVIVFENYPLEPTQGIAGLDLLDVSITEQTHYPLTLFAVATETLTFKALYDPQRFTERAIARLLRHLHTALAAMATSAQNESLCELGHIDIIPTDEQQQLLKFAQPSSSGEPEVLVQDAIAHHASRTPNATAVIFNGDSLSYAQLNSRANQLAHSLQQQGVPSNALVGVCVERCIEMVVALLAILKAGCAYVPLDPTYPAARLQYAIKDAGFDWILCHDPTAQLFNLEEQQLKQINLSQVASAIAAQPMSAPQTATSLNDLAYLIYTSGSTGQPKGVPIRHQSLSNLLMAMANRLQVKPTDTLMAVTTLAFDIAALELFLPLISGACLLIASNEVSRNSHQLIAYLDIYGVDIMQATPTTWRMLLSSGWAGQNSLRILCGGEALDFALAKRLLNCGEEVWNVYGPTETTIWSGALALSEEMLACGSVPIGDPIDNTQFYVLDDQQQLAPLGVAGELYIGGLGLSRGYWHREDLTAARFVGVEVLGCAGLMTLYKTGDRVRYREDGTLGYLGRLDYQTKLRGYRIELGEIEAAIAAHKRINQTVVVLQGETAENQQLVAYVTLVRGDDDGSEMAESVARRLRSHLTTQLPHYMVPTAYRVMSAFPLTPNGKVDRKALPAITIPATTPDARPKTAIETTLAEIWKSILPLKTVGIHDNFFEIGGHSLLVVNAQSQIRQRIGIELSMVDLFRYPTLNTLAIHISQLDQQRNTQAPKERSVALAVGKQRLRRQLAQRKGGTVQ